MVITYRTGGSWFTASLAPGISGEEAARALKAEEWREITEDEFLRLQAPTLEEARAAKLAAIVSGANAVKALLSARFSTLEETTWPEQEAGARAILNDTENVKDKTARLILCNETGTSNAVALVNRLAEVDGNTPEEFAKRVVANADLAHLAGIATLLEQRSMEAATHAAGTPEEILAVTVAYSALSPSP